MFQSNWNNYSKRPTIPEENGEHSRPIRTLKKKCKPREHCNMEAWSNSYRIHQKTAQQYCREILLFYIQNIVVIQLITASYGLEYYGFRANVLKWFTDYLFNRIRYVLYNTYNHLMWSTTRLNIGSLFIHTVCQQGSCGLPYSVHFHTGQDMFSLNYQSQFIESQ